MDLWDAVGASPGAVVSVIGAGGKTATVLALARQAKLREQPALVTTTTKMWLPDLPLVLSHSIPDLESRVRSALHAHPVVAAGSGTGDGKLIGLDPAAVCSIGSTGIILCEADGAAGHSLKVHRPGEPVVPACTTHLIVVAALDALGRSFMEAAHPAALAAGYFGEGPAAAIREDHVAGALLEGATFSPGRASLVFLLNKAEGLERVAAGRRISRLLNQAAPSASVLLVSQGQVLKLEISPSG